MALFLLVLLETGCQSNAVGNRSSTLNRVVQQQTQGGLRSGIGTLHPKSAKQIRERSPHFLSQIEGNRRRRCPVFGDGENCLDVVWAPEHECEFDHCIAVAWSFPSEEAGSYAVGFGPWEQVHCKILRDTDRGQEVFTVEVRRVISRTPHCRTMKLAVPATAEMTRVWYQQETKEFHSRRRFEDKIGTDSSFGAVDPVEVRSDSDLLSQVFVTLGCGVDKTHFLHDFRTRCGWHQRPSDSTRMETSSGGRRG